MQIMNRTMPDFLSNLSYFLERSPIPRCTFIVKSNYVITFSIPVRKFAILQEKGKFKGGFGPKVRDLEEIPQIWKKFKILNAVWRHLKNLIKIALSKFQDDFRQHSRIHIFIFVSHKIFR